MASTFSFQTGVNETRVIDVVALRRRTHPERKIGKDAEDETRCRKTSREKAGTEGTPRGGKETAEAKVEPSKQREKAKREDDVERGVGIGTLSDSVHPIQGGVDAAQTG